jgi:hypothetical protein
MRGERYQNAIVLILIVLVFASVPLILNFVGTWFLWAPLLVAFAVLPSVFLREVDLAAGLHGPAQVRDALAADLRNAGFAVTPGADSVEARMDALSAVSFRTRITDQGTVLSGRLRATPTGRILVVALVVSVIGSGPAALLSLVLFLRATRLARSHGPSAFRGAISSAPTPGTNEIHGMLIGGLSTALGMSRDAFNAQEKAYTDAKSYLMMTVFTVWLAVLVGLFVALNGFNLETGVWDLPIGGAIGAALVVGVGLFMVLRRRFVPRLARYRTWSARLSAAFEQEMSPTDREPPTTSTFELLAEASTQVPDWLDAQRLAGLSGDPGTSFIILFLSSACASLLLNGIIGGLRGAFVAFATYLGTAAVLAAFAGWFYLRWKRREDARLGQSRAAWDAHVKTLRARMDRFLQEM